MTLAAKHCHIQKCVGRIHKNTNSNTNTNINSNRNTNANEKRKRKWVQKTGTEIETVTETETENGKTYRTEPKMFWERTSNWNCFELHKMHRAQTVGYWITALQHYWSTGLLITGLFALI